MHHLTLLLDRGEWVGVVSRRLIWAERELGCLVTEITNGGFLD